MQHLEVSCAVRPILVAVRRQMVKKKSIMMHGNVNVKLENLL